MYKEVVVYVPYDYERPEGFVARGYHRISVPQEYDPEEISAWDILYDSQIYRLPDKQGPN